MESIKKKWLWGIFISILSIFAMSHNANAINTVIDLTNYSNIRSFTSDLLSCSFTNGTDLITLGTSCKATINQTTTINNIETSNTYNFKKDDLITFNFIMYSNTEGFQYYPRFMEMTNSSDWDIISYNVMNADDYFSSLYSFNGYLNSQGPNYDFNVDFYRSNAFYRIYDITLRARSDGAKHIGLNSNYGLYSFSGNDTRQQLTFTLKNFKQFRYEGSVENKEVEEKTQEAVDDSEAAGGSSSQDAQSGTTGLLSAITGAVSVISSASPTNCKINGNMGNLDMGQLDLCANPAPAFIQTIGSLILILMCVPLAISLFNRFIAIFRSFQS